MRADAKIVAVPEKRDGVMGFAKPAGIFDDCPQNGPDVGR